MSPHKISTASTTTTTAVAQASMAAPFTGLKSTAAFPVTSKSNSDFSSLPSNGSMVPCAGDLWKLPMFGCTDASQVLNELDEAIKAYPNSFIKMIGFDNVRQVRCISFIAYKPAGY